MMGVRRSSVTGVAVELQKQGLVSYHRGRKTGGRMIHFIKATDRANSDRQIAELWSSGKVGPRDGFLSLTGWTPLH